MACVCPHCKMVMCQEEARAGVCPVCTGALPWGTPVPAEAPPPTPPPSKPLRWLAPGLFAAGLLTLAVLLLNRRPEAKSEEEIDDSSVAAVGEKKPELPASRQEPRDPPKTTSIAEPKKTVPAVATKKTTEPRKPDDVKKDTKKPVDPKPGKIENPEPDPLLGGERIVKLPLLGDDAIKFDGDLSDWKGIAPLILKPVERGRVVHKPVLVPKEQKAYLAYDRKGILVAVDVVDTSGKLENAPQPAKGMWPFWDNDAVEVFLETANVRVHRRGALTAHQFFAFPLGTPTDAPFGGYESKIVSGKGGKQEWTIVPHPNTGATPMLRGGRKTPTGWTMELLIPYSALRQAEIKPGKVVSLELQIGTGTHVYYTWACDNSQVRVSEHPDFWGEARFAGSDARIEILDMAKRPANSFAPARPLTVRVTDPDMNLDPTKKEKVSVSLRARSGDDETLTLEESTPASGVFVGSIPTRLRTAARADRILEVIDGEEVTIEYVDQLCGTGARNVPVRAVFTVDRRRR